jgi:hypothetical protein
MRSGIDDERLADVLKDALSRKPRDKEAAAGGAKGNGLRTIGG